MVLKIINWIGYFKLIILEFPHSTLYFGISAMNDCCKLFTQFCSIQNGDVLQMILLLRVKQKHDEDDLIVQL